ncbi:MAG: hypothetical protein R2838_06895 [Caldilineaceae bacterium]
MIFTIGFITAMSTYHMEARHPGGSGAAAQLRAAGRLRRARLDAHLGMTVRSRPVCASSPEHQPAAPDIPAGQYLHLIGALFLFHFGQYFVIPLFPLRWVNLGFSDGAISLGTAVFYLAVLIGSIPFDGLTRSWATAAW